MNEKRQSMGDKLKMDGLKIESYLNGLYRGTYSKILLKTFEKDKSFLQVPLSEAKVLECLVRLAKPKRILEIGTFRGFSTAFLAKHSKGKVFSIERDAKKYEEIESLWKKVGINKKAKLIKNHAIPALKKLVLEKHKFDFIFIDASKQETLEYFKICYHKLTVSGATIVVDNTLWGGEVVDDFPKSNLALYMKKFNEYVFKKHKTESYILPSWDGVTIISKK